MATAHPTFDFQSDSLFSILNSLPGSIGTRFWSFSALIMSRFFSH